MDPTGRLMRSVHGSQYGPAGLLKTDFYTAVCSHASTYGHGEVTPRPSRLVVKRAHQTKCTCGSW